MKELARNWKHSAKWKNAVEFSVVCGGGGGGGGGGETYTK